MPVVMPQRSYSDSNMLSMLADSFGAGAGQYFRHKADQPDYPAGSIEAPRIDTTLKSGMPTPPPVFAEQAAQLAAPMDPNSFNFQEAIPASPYFNIAQNQPFMGNGNIAGLLSGYYGAN